MRKMAGKGEDDPNKSQAMKRLLASSELREQDVKKVLRSQGAPALPQKQAPPKPSPAPEKKPEKPKPASDEPDVMPLTRSVPPEVLANFFRSLQVMVTSGISIHFALEYLLVGQHPALGPVIEDVLRRVNNGSMLSRAMAAHPRAFPGVAVGLIRAGETSGYLDLMLGSIADYLERSLKLRRKLIAALTYPAMIFGVGVIVLAVLSIVVFPREQEIYKGMGLELPWVTRAVSAVMGFIFNWTTLITVNVVVATAWVTWPYLGRSLYQSKLRRPLSALVLSIPLIGPIIEKTCCIRMLLTMSNFLQAGVGMAHMQPVGKVAENAILEEKFAGFLERMKQGMSMGTALHDVELFPAVVIQMFRLGEEHGRLPFLLRKAAEMLEEDVTWSLDTLTALLEPMMMMLMGVMVGGIVIATSLPTLQMLDRL